MITKDDIIIRKDLTSVYRVASDIKNQHTFIPGYLPSKILKWDNNEFIVERTAKMGKKILKWKSKGKLVKNKFIEFIQLEGRLKGMKIKWLFEELSNNTTKVTIIHNFKISYPVVGLIAGIFIAKPTINKITRNVLIGLKNKVENLQ